MRPPTGMPRRPEGNPADPEAGHRPARRSPASVGRAADGRNDPHRHPGRPVPRSVRQRTARPRKSRAPEHRLRPEIRAVIPNATGIRTLVGFDGPRPLPSGITHGVADHRQGDAPTPTGGAHGEAGYDPNVEAMNARRGPRSLDAGVFAAGADRDPSDRLALRKCDQTGCRRATRQRLHRPPTARPGRSVPGQRAKTRLRQTRMHAPAGGPPAAAKDIAQRIHEVGRQRAANDLRTHREPAAHPPPSHEASRPQASAEAPRTRSRPSPTAGRGAPRPKPGGSGPQPPPGARCGTT